MAPTERRRVLAASDQFVEHTTSAALEEKAKLQKHFSRFDIYFFLICTIVGVDTLGAGRRRTAPRASLAALPRRCSSSFRTRCLTAELGSAFPEEGGAYVWTRLSFGRLTAAINAVFYWFSNPIWIGATLALLRCAAIQCYFYNFDNDSVVYYLVGLGLHLVLGLFGDPLVRYRQVDPDTGRLVPDLRDRPVLGHARSSTRSSTACTSRRAASSSRPTRCSSRSRRCCSSTTSASSCPTQRATR